MEPKSGVGEVAGRVKGKACRLKGLSVREAHRL